MGRPPKHPAEALSQRLEIRVTIKERRDAVAAAKRAKLRLSEWLRAAVHKALRG